MKPKPTIKKIRGQEIWLASYESASGKKYEVESDSFESVLKKWYSKYKKEFKLGGG